MARRKKGDGHAGGHGWYVTFADLMALLMAFFVVVAASSSQDKEKLQQALGSIRDAFGVQTERPLQGAILEVDGLPVRSHVRNSQQAEPSQTTSQPGPISDELEQGPLRVGRDFTLSLAASTLRQAIQDMPEISEISRHIVIEERPDGVAIQLMDQDGRSMFAEGSKEPYERTRAVLAKIAPVLRQLPHRLAISGHTSAAAAASMPGYGPWDLSADRANAVREILAENGVPNERFYSVTGRADTDPMFPDNPFLAANRRVTILLMQEKPPLPAGARL
jgi:chemotaxis protein MotB